MLRAEDSVSQNPESFATKGETHSLEGYTPPATIAVEGLLGIRENIECGTLRKFCQMSFDLIEGRE